VTHVLRSNFTEKLGIAEVQRISAKARTIFRPTNSDDVGIDGFLELVEDGMATGIIAGVQIKSGSSFVDESGIRFTFKSDREHFGYWARCSFPVIGIVFSPDHEKSVWFDLTGLSTDNRIANGSYSINLEYSDESAFTPLNLNSKIAQVIRKYSHQRRTLWQIRELIQPNREKATLDVPSIEVSSEREEAWRELIQVFLGFSSTDDEVADAGYRLSWYFPAVSEQLQQLLKENLTQIDSFLIVRTLRVIHELMENNDESVADLIIDLLSYIPEIAKRIEMLVREYKVSSAYIEAAIQTIETLEEVYRDDLRELFSE
jgi:hypothetical protein